MSNRFAGKYNIDYSSLRPTPREEESARHRADRKREQAARAQLLPALGGAAIGGIAGSSVGMPLEGLATGSKLGAAVGGVGGQYFSGQADAEEDPMREKQYRRMAILQALQAAR